MLALKKIFLFTLNVLFTFVKKLRYVQLNCLFRLGFVVHPTKSVFSTHSIWNS